MQIELQEKDTRVLVSSESWNRGLKRIVVGDKEIPFLLPALSGHHFFTGIWPPPSNAIDYEPHQSPGSFEKLSDISVVWHQPKTPYTQIETFIEFKIVETGTIEARFKTRSHAKSYPHGYVGLFWGTIPTPGGQRGIHIMSAEKKGGLKWYYFQGGGDNECPHANTVLGPRMSSYSHSPGHPMTYFFAESKRKFALPIQVGRWRDMYYSVEVERLDIGFTDVLLGTAVGGSSWDIHWQLEPGETKELCCRLTIGEWRGWETIEKRYRSWHGCFDPSFKIEPTGYRTYQAFSIPESIKVRDDSGLSLSRKLFETRGKELLEQLNIEDLCSVACLGGASQNAGLDDKVSRDHIWGPYLTFLLQKKDWRNHSSRLKTAIKEMPDEVSGVSWLGYDGPNPRRTEVREFESFLQMLTGFKTRPTTDQEWLPYINESSFLGRWWTERLFDARQGQIFHDPRKQLTQIWRHWTAYVPPDIHKALLARSLFRV